MKFEYFETKTVNADIEIEDIGNCAIKAYTDLGSVYILIIDTVCGYSRIFQYGPAYAEMPTLLCDHVGMSLNRIEFKEKPICKTIEMFLNRDGITQAIECTRDEALECCTNILEQLNNFDF